MLNTNQIFTSTNNHLLHKEAIDLIVHTLPGAVSMDAIAGYDAPYHVEWNGMKFIVKVARPSRKLSQKRAKWFYALRDKDHMAGDYFPGLVIDRAEKRAYIEPVECNVCGQQYPRTMNTCPYCKD